MRFNTSQFLARILPALTFMGGLGLQAMLHHSSPSWLAEISAPAAEAAGTVPASPSGLTGQYNGKSAVQLNWKDNATDETSQQIWISTNGSGYTKLTNLAGNVTAYTHALSSTAGAIYYYTVRAVNIYGASGFAPVAKVTVSGTATQPPPSTGTTTYLTDVLNEVNTFRFQNGRAALRMNDLLAKAAKRHSDDMAARSAMSHNCGDGTTMVQRVNQTGYVWRALAENVAAGQSSPRQVVQAWINSPGHRANMLNTSVKDAGIGYNNKYWTLDLGG